MLGQDWQTILVLDYTFPLPPLAQGKTFNEVRIAAYTGEVPTKFLYFGTELNDEAPRVPPEMENVVSPTGTFQEYRLTPDSCSVAYLDLIQTHAARLRQRPAGLLQPADQGRALRCWLRRRAHQRQDFPHIVAGLDPIDSSMLTDPRFGFWQGARFAGTKQMAILKQGEGRWYPSPRERRARWVPPEVVRRDPHVEREGCLGRCGSGLVDHGDRHRQARRSERARTPRLTARRREYRATTKRRPEVGFNNLPALLKAWRVSRHPPVDRVGWDVVVGHAARDRHACMHACMHAHTRPPD